MRSRFWFALPVVAVTTIVVGCDIKALLPPPPQAAAPAPAPAPGPPPETNNALIMAHRAGKRMELTLQMQQLAILAFNASINNMEFAKDWDSLIASDPNNKAFYDQLREAGVVVVWDAANYEKQVGPSNTILAYGPWALEEGGPVATLDGRAQQYMSAEDLKAKLAAMGVEPVKPEPAAPAPATTDPAAPGASAPADAAPATTPAP